MRGITLETGVILVVLPLIVALLFYYLYINFVSSQKTLTGQQCDALLNTACQAYRQGTPPGAAFKNVPNECVDVGNRQHLSACKEGNREACEIICELWIVGEPEEFGVI
jgi:hypothetical protein